MLTVLTVFFPYQPVALPEKLAEEGMGLAGFKKDI
jgi:hypothetical protein